LTKKGTIDSDKFYIPKILIEHFDSRAVWFKIDRVRVTSI